MQASSARTWSAVVALTVAALVLRLVGVGFGVPCWEEPDPDIPGHVDMLRSGSTLAGVEHPDQQYPHLIADLARWLPARPEPRGEDAPRTLAAHLRAAAWTHVQVRELVALLSTLLVPLTFLLARRFVSPGWALFAAASIAVSLLHQSFSQQARPHGVAATFFALAVLADMRLARRGTWLAYLAAGVATALALGTLHSALALLVPGLAAHALRRDEGARWFDVKLLLPLALCCAAVPLFYPFLFEHAAAEGADGSGLRIAEHSVAFSQFHGHGFPVIAQVLWNYEPLLSGLLVLAVAVWCAARAKTGSWRPSSELWVALSFALPYLLVIGLFERTYERFVIPLLPFFAIFAAWALQRVASRWRPGLVAGAAALALALPAAATAKLAWLRARPDTLGQVAQWLSAQPDGLEQRVYLSASAPSLDLPLFRRPGGVLLNGKRPRVPLSPWSAWQARVPDEFAPAERYDLRWLSLPREAAARGDLGGHLASLGPALFVIEVFERRTNHALLVALREALKQRGTLLGRFSPDPDPEAGESEFFFQLSDHFNDDEILSDPHFTARLLRARAIGPVLEVWRVPAAPEGR